MTQKYNRHNQYCLFTLRWAVVFYGHRKEIDYISHLIISNLFRIIIVYRPFFQHVPPHHPVVKLEPLERDLIALDTCLWHHNGSRFIGVTVGAGQVL